MVMMVMMIVIVIIIIIIITVITKQPYQHVLQSSLSFFIKLIIG